MATKAKTAGSLRKYAKKYIPLKEIRKWLIPRIAAEAAREGLDGTPNKGENSNRTEISSS